MKQASKTYRASAEKETSGGTDMHSIEIKELQEKVFVLTNIIMNCPSTKKYINETPDMMSKMILAGLA
jgi:hypothetical protein